MRGNRNQQITDIWPKFREKACLFNDKRIERCYFIPVLYY